MDITVLLSTYNGEKYLREQIDSILKQKNVKVKLLVRDDMSTDHTLDILMEYKKKYDNINTIKADKNLGACKSFFHLMTEDIDTEFIALADQDDVWDDDKLIIAIRQLSKYPNNFPMMYHSNLRIVDDNNNYQRKAHSFPQVAKTRYSFLAEPLSTGCTIVYNHALADYARRIRPMQFSMHDAWLYSIASIYGKVIYDFEPHLNYRQHSLNVVGASEKKISKEAIRKEWNKIFHGKEPRYHNAQELLSELGKELCNEDIIKINKVTNYKNSFRDTLSLLFDKDIKPSSFYRTFMFVIKILLKNI